MKRPVLPIVIAVFLAVAAGAIVFWFVTSAEDRALAQQDVATVVVTTDVVPEGTTLAEAEAAGLLETTSVPARLRPASALAGIDGANGSLVVLADLPAGQQVLQAAVGSEVVRDRPIEVPDGQMAVSVLLDDPSKVGAFLRPGSHVAVFDTFAVESDDPLSPVGFQTRVLLDDVVVLAVGAVTRSGEDAAQSDAWEAQLVTVAVTQDQAERLVHAARTGALHFALLGETTELMPTAGVSDETLFR